jgi:adenylate cyclase class 2
MAFEIELKARLDEPFKLKERLNALAQYECAYEKDDAYWVLSKPEAGPCPNTGDIPVPAGSFAGNSGVRVRREQNTGVKGHSSERVLVTCKVKEVREGIEINDEREFEVSDGAAFGELLKRLGLEPGVRKHKQGWAWFYGNIHAELCEVSGKERSSGDHSLGWFLELEILADDAEVGTVAAARKELLELLGRLAVGKKYIEERYYSEMLGEA